MRKNKNKNKRKFLSWISMKYVVIAFIAIISLYTATDIYKNYNSHIEPVRYTEDHSEIIKESEYIISKAMVLNNLQTKAQIVSFKQDLHKEEIYTDKNALGKRSTELELDGTYKMGLNTSDIKLKHIDSENRIAYVELPKPVLISLDIPYDKIEFGKKQGFFRLAMNEDEQKNFYKSAIKNVEKSLYNDKEIIRQANVFNEDAVREIIMSTTDIKSVIFE